VQAFVHRPSICFPTKCKRSMIFSTLARAPTRPVKDEEEYVYRSAAEKVKRRREPLSGEEINYRLAIQMEKLRIKDASSPLLSKEVSCPLLWCIEVSYACGFSLLTTARARLYHSAGLEGRL
jgi:hypothetical protein